MSRASRGELLALAKQLGIDLPEHEFMKLLDEARKAPDPRAFIRARVPIPKASDPESPATPHPATAVADAPKSSNPTAADADPPLRFFGRATQALYNLAKELEIPLQGDEMVRFLDRAGSARQPENFIREAAETWFKKKANPATQARRESTAAAPPANPRVAACAEPGANAVLSRLASEAGEQLLTLEAVVLKFAERVPPENVRHGSFRFLEHFGTAERRLFQALDLDEREVLREAQRLWRLVKWRSQAGTAADRMAAGQRATDTATALDSRGPSLRVEIERLTRELTELETAASTAAKDVATRQAAVEALLADCTNPDLLVPPRRHGWNESPADYVARVLG